MKEIEETNNCIKRSANLFQGEKNIGTRLDRYTMYYSIMQIEIFINTISEIGIKVEMYSFFSCNGIWKSNIEQKNFSHGVLFW